MICNNKNKEACFAYRKDGQCHCLERVCNTIASSCKFFKTKEKRIEELKAEAETQGIDFNDYVKGLKNDLIIHNDLV